MKDTDNKGQKYSDDNSFFKGGKIRGMINNSISREDILYKFTRLTPDLMLHSSSNMKAEDILRKKLGDFDFETFNKILTPEFRNQLYDCFDDVLKLAQLSFPEGGIVEFNVPVRVQPLPISTKLGEFYYAMAEDWHLWDEQAQGEYPIQRVFNAMKKFMQENKSNSATPVYNYSEEDILSRFVPRTNELLLKNEPLRDCVLLAIKYALTLSSKICSDEEIQADINNKLTPVKNMIAMMEKGDPRLNGLIEKEMNQCKKNIEYLSTLPSRPIKGIKVGNEKIDKLNLQQKSGKVHPYTCDRKSKQCQVNLNDGVLIATKDGWICPCGEYKQKINQSCIPTEGKEITDEEITNLLSEAFETNTSITVEDDSTDKAEMTKDFIKAYRDLMNNK